MEQRRKPGVPAFGGGGFDFKPKAAASVLTSAPTDALGQVRERVSKAPQPKKAPTNADLMVSVCPCGRMSCKKGPRHMVPAAQALP
ncbi:hypothetical protein [Hyphomicrobium sp.]|uniref:hypothetical protein n=1 Tax=Hyphomicrobium sp. TaxID=82 RepID=UPI001D5E6CE3|nr:hypothetical protein [Hyphomicrobium sp.]MBY0561485.1 hypothetical protein [Hyphomicrobium sp.]